MLNWEMEFKKWCPAFKLLTYFGSAKERKIKRHGWSKPNAFHICITSYTLVLQVSGNALTTKCIKHPCASGQWHHAHIQVQKGLDAQGSVVSQTHGRAHSRVKQA